MIDLMLGIEAAPHARTRSSPGHRDVGDRRAGARGALLAAGRRLERKTADPRPQTRDLIENPFNQLLDATDPTGTTSFTWDGNGNQTQKAEPTGTTSYTWDARDRLAEIAQPDGTTARYGYDTENLRVSMDDADGARRILLDGLEEMSEYDGATGERSARFDHDPTRIDALLAQTSDTGSAAMLADALGSVYGLADDAAVMRARFGYDVYGARSPALGEIRTRWGFTGRGHDAAPSLLYARQRVLDVFSGIWLSEDPENLRTVEFGGATWSPLHANRFLYAVASPVRFGDPMGTAVPTFDNLLELQIFAGAVAGVTASRASSPAVYIIAALFTLVLLSSAAAGALAGSREAEQLARDIRDALEGLGALIYHPAPQVLVGVRICAAVLVDEICRFFGYGVEHATGARLCVYHCSTGLKGMAPRADGSCRQAARESKLEFFH